jgi:hypothetical protein
LRDSPDPRWIASRPGKLYSIQFETGATDAFDTWLFGLEFF